MLSANTLNVLATVVGAIGVLVCLIAGVWRLTGNYYLASFESWTVYFVGVGLMVAACFVKLDILCRRA